MKMNKKGFTLIEMLVVIAIIAILVAIIIPTVSNATTKAKEATDVANIRSAVAQYEINSLNGSATWPADLKINFTSNYEAPTSANGMTVKYTATVLADGSGNKVYTWSLGDLVTGS